MTSADDPKSQTADSCTKFVQGGRPVHTGPHLVPENKDCGCDLGAQCGPQEVWMGARRLRAILCSSGSSPRSPGVEAECGELGGVSVSAPDQVNVSPRPQIKPLSGPANDQAPCPSPGAPGRKEL